MNIRTKTQIAFAALMMAPLSGGAQTPAPIHVVLNGTPLTFTGTQAQQIKGSTLVPMRGIFEALGATVKFDKATQTVYGQKGATAIILPLGALTATVNGQPQSLPLPAQLINGTTLVPLRFISQSLGASVGWNPASSTVTIQTVDPHLAALPTVAGNKTINGEVTGIYTNTTPTQLTVRVGGANTTVPLSATTIILRSVDNLPATEVLLSEIKPGDQVSVQRGDNGTATVVTASFGQVKGKIVSFGHLASGAATLTLDSGRTIELTADAPITFEGAAVSLSDIKPYETVVVRTNPANNLGYGVAVSTAANPNPTPPGHAPTLANAPGPGNAPASVFAPAVPPNDPNAAILDGNVSSLEVTSFTDDAKRPLRAGDVLHTTLSGTHGGKATFSIPGVAENVPMSEFARGLYVGSYTVVRGVAARDAAVIGKLVVGGVQSPLIQAAGLLSIDSQPPRITDFGPAQNASIESDRPVIYATLSDGAGTGVNPAATQLRVDGKDVTADAEITGSLFTYKPPAPLAGGSHTVSVSIADKAGNTTTTGWSFGVSTGSLIQSFTTNEPSGQAVGAGSTVVFTLAAAPGGKASAGIGSLAKIALKETDPGVYVGEYTVRPGDTLANAPVQAKFTTRDGTAVLKNLSTTLNLAAGPPPAPRIVEPRNSDYVDGNAPLVVRGRGLPGSTVRVTVSYTSKALGGILPVSGQSGTRDVQVGKDGLWESEGIPLQTKSLFTANRDTVFTVSAVQLDASGSSVSEPVTVTVRPG